MGMTDLRPYAERIADGVPRALYGVPVPAEVAAVWKTWQGASWRRGAWMSLNRLHPPDQRFGVLPLPGMCAVHMEMRRGYRDMYFDDRSGNRWPGTPGSPFTIIDHDLGRELAWRRAEWDDKASEQMQLTERICLSGRSPQCSDPRTCAVCAWMPGRCVCVTA